MSSSRQRRAAALEARQQNRSAARRFSEGLHLGVHDTKTAGLWRLVTAEWRRERAKNFEQWLRVGPAMGSSARLPPAKRSGDPLVLVPLDSDPAPRFRRRRATKAR